MTDQVEALQAAGLAVSLKDEGIQLDVAATFDPDALSPELLGGNQAQASPNRILERIPDDALAFYSGQDLASLWRSAFNSLMSVPDAAEQLQDYEDVVGIRLDEDFLSWLSGEYAIAVTEAYGMEDVPFCGFGLLQVDDQLAAEDRLGELTDVLEMMGGITFEDESVNGVEMQVLYDPWLEEIIGGYGFDDGLLVIGVPREGLEKATEPDMTPITDDDAFKAVRGQLPGTATGYLYVNLEDTTDLLCDSMDDYERDGYDTEVRPYIGPIRALGLAASPTDLDKGVSHITLFVYIP